MNFSVMRLLVGVLAMAGCRATYSAAQATTVSACTNDQYLRNEAMRSAQSLLEDRLGENAFNLPWVNTSPPELVTDARLCSEAARRYSRMNGTDQHITEAVVVAFGGLYLVHGNPTISAGEFGVTLITDRKFRILQRHLGW